MARRKQPVIPDQLLDQLLAGTDAKMAFEKNGLLDELKKALAERVLNAEMDHHLDAGAADGRANSRNGYGKKQVLTETGKIALEVPRDRLSTFDPQLIAKYQRRFPGFDEKIISMYARGMSVREIQGHLRELYGIDVSPDLISAVTEAVLEEVTDCCPGGAPRSAINWLTALSSCPGGTQRWYTSLAAESTCRRTYLLFRRKPIWTILISLRLALADASSAGRQRRPRLLLRGAR